jgi:hypothetical protein
MSLDEEELLFCAGGTKVGFLIQAYDYAIQNGYKTSAYLSGKVYSKQYEHYACDEVVYALPISPSIPPTWEDVSQTFIYDLDYHFSLSTPDSGMLITLKEYAIAQERMQNLSEDQSFYSEMFELQTW